MPSNLPRTDFQEPLRDVQVDVGRQRIPVAHRVDPRRVAGDHAFPLQARATRA